MYIEFEKQIDTLEKFIFKNSLPLKKGVSVTLKPKKTYDKEKSFIKWDGGAPSFVSNLTDTKGPYSHTEILEILSEEEWTSDPLAEDLSNVPSDEDVEEADEITEEMFEVLNDEAEESVDENTE